MPTTHVTRESHDTLQDIANSLLKARKVVVVTGAGISTNSGIPDFRSENGLYSLIQAQFDAAAHQARSEVENIQRDSEADDTEEDRPAKRRRLSSSDTIEVVGEQEIKEEIKEEIEVEGEEIEIEVREEVREVVEVGIELVRDEIECQGDVICVQDPDTEDSIVVEGDGDVDSREIRAATAPVLPVSRRTTRSSPSCITVAHPPTSPLSSPPPDDIVESPLSFKKLHRNRIEGMTTVPPSSSPLSSPPPGLFDPYDATSSDGQSAHSTSPSETDDSPPSTNPFSASQSSGRALPNMKGKDMFDASIWSDPLRTSIFYQFATSLRQKSKDAEPTVSHRFIKHLRDRGKLVRCYTQNIDQIEEKVGLSTCLHEGPGSRGRFSRKSTATINQLAMMVEETNISVDSSMDKSQQSSDESSQQTQPSSDGTRTSNTGDTDQSPSDTPKADQLRRDLRPGVECVYLHGSLQRLRCFLCGRVCDWDDRELETLNGQQPECPFCVCATIAREEKGKRALGVGKLRPDIVLYGEEHPNSHLISPIITHDLALCPDILLILGTSLRVHGLKFMVREFAKAVHSKGGKVVFVNFTKPPESSWGDVIDYWIEWDCDAWVADLQDKIPRLWQAPEPPKPKRKREEGASDDSNKRVRKYAKNPSALRPTKAVACVQVLRILDGLHKTTGAPPRTPMKVRATQPAPAPKAAIPAKSADNQTNTTTNVPSDTAKIKVEDVPTTGKRVRKPRPRQGRMSAPGVMQPSQPEDATSTPNNGRTLRSGSVQPPKVPRLTGNGFELIKRKFVPRPLMEPEPQQSRSLPEPQLLMPSMVNPQPPTPSLPRPQPPQRSLPRPQPPQRSLSQPQPSRRSLPAPSLPRPHLPEPVSSIGAFIKSNPRSRKRKNVFGEGSPSADRGDAEAGVKSEAPVVWSAPVRGWAYEVVPEPPKLQLPDLQGYSPPHTRSGHKRPTPIEPSRIHQPLPEPPSDHSSPTAADLHQPHGSPSLTSGQHLRGLASHLRPLRPMSNNPQRTLHIEAYKLQDPLIDHFPRPTPPHSPITPPPPSKRLPAPPAEQANSRRITRSSVAPVEHLKRILPRLSAAPTAEKPRRMASRLTVPEDAARRPRSPEDLMAAETLAGMGRPRQQPPPAPSLRRWGEHWPSHGVQSGLS